MIDDATSQETETPTPKWQPISAIDRRVVGALVEKGKTTPNAYPLSLNGVVAGCNQKSNRDPVMKLEPEDVEDSLDRLRELGAVGLVEGYGRVSKYRHYLYEWLGVEKIELSVMAELLLRGPQTVGELRGRASRMDSIADLAALKPILDALKAKGLVIPLTPEGRGHVVTHALYEPNKLVRIREQYAAGAPGVDSTSPPPTPPAPQTSSKPSPELHTATQGEIDELRAQVVQLRSDLEEIGLALQQTKDDVQQLKQDLGV